MFNGRPACARRRRGARLEGQERAERRAEVRVRGEAVGCENFGDGEAVAAVEPAQTCDSLRLLPAPTSFERIDESLRTQFLRQLRFANNEIV